jgi:hypothetical protein
MHGELAAWIGRMPMPSQIGDDQLITAGEFFKKWIVRAAASHEAMQKNHRGALSDYFVVHLHAVNRSRICSGCRICENTDGRYDGKEQNHGKNDME